MDPHPPPSPPRQDTAAEQRQRAIAIGAIALVVLLFGIFLISLTGGDEAESAGGSPAAPQPAPAAASAPPRPARAPLEKAIDYAHDPRADEADASPDLDPFAGRRAMQAADPAGTADGAEADEPEGLVITEGEAPAAVLHCDSFENRALAEEQKARLAFAGMQSAVVQYEGRIMLRLGPFASRDEARDRFNQLAAQQLLQQCSLTDVDQP